MTDTNIQSTGVVGAGLMGRDVAAMLAAAGFDVTLVDVDDDALDAAARYHETTVPGLADAVPDAETPIRPRLAYERDVSALTGAGFVVEAVPERLPLKRRVLSDLEAVLDRSAVVGTNTSSLTAGDVAADLAHRERVVLFHFANPAIDRSLVEVGGDDATEASIETAVAVGEAIGKEPVVLDRERRANGLSRLSAAIKCAATWEALAADPAAIDRGAVALGFPKGPFELMDGIGLDVHVATVENLAGEYGDRFAPPPSMRARMDAMVEAGRLGRKTGEGFFEWADGRPVRPDVEEPHDVTPVVAALVDEAHRIVADGVADRERVDAILRRGGGGDAGPFELGELLGYDFLRATLEERHAETGAAIYEPAPSFPE